MRHERIQDASARLTLATPGLTILLAGQKQARPILASLLHRDHHHGFHPHPLRTPFVQSLQFDLQPPILQQAFAQQQV